MCILYSVFLIGFEVIMLYIYSKVVITIERLDSVEPVRPSLPAGCRDSRSGKLPVLNLLSG